MRCPLCANQENLKYLESSASYTIYQCMACSLSFSDPMKAADSAHYEIVEWYGDRWEFSETLRFLSNTKGKILEIGCGKGFFLSRARAAGFDVTGIDFNEKAIESAKSSALKKVFSLPLEEFRKQYPDERFDLICFYHVLEHLEDPVGFLANIKKILNPGGHIAFSFPNPDRLDLALLKREKWDYPPHHLTRWNGKSTEYLLGKTGYIKVFSDKEPLSILRATESLGTFIEGRSSGKVSVPAQSANEAEKINMAAVKPGEKKIYYALKRSIKPFLMGILLPAGIILYMIGKNKNLTGQAMLVIAKAAG